MDRIIDGEQNERQALIEGLKKELHTTKAAKVKAEEQRDRARSALLWRNAISCLVVCGLFMSSWSRETNLEAERDQARELAAIAQRLTAVSMANTDECLADAKRSKSVYESALANDDRQWHTLLWTAQECSALAKKAVQRFQKCETARKYTPELAPNGLMWRTPAGEDLQVGPNGLWIRK